MTTRQKTSRPNFVRQGHPRLNRSAHTPKRTIQSTPRTFQHTAASLPLRTHTETRRALRPASGVTNVRAARNPHRNSYEFAFTLGRTNVCAPALTLPKVGPRWVSAGLILILSFTIFAMWTATPFTITTADVHGNQRVSVSDINSAIGMMGQSIIKVIPTQIEANLHTAFPDLESIKVHVSLPNQISVVVKERIPVVAWFQDGAATWIDANGVAFLPRGDFPGLIQVSASDTPELAQTDSSRPFFNQKFIAPEMVQTLVDLAGQVPAGTPILFDPHYGFGWQDPRGWTVYFGQNNKDIPMKKTIYQAIVDSLTLQGVQPTLISVAYLNAPFYK
jgi:hypothetical protein